MKNILKLLFEYIIALGGVAIGIIKAQLADKIKGSSNSVSSILFVSANILRIGSRRNVVAVLLVNSVKIEVKRAINKIRVNKFKCLKSFKNNVICFANPDEIIREASAKPPPKRINIFHGIFLNHSFVSITLPFLAGIKKNRDAPNIAIIESVNFIFNSKLIFDLNIHKRIVKVIMNVATLSFLEYLPNLRYLFVIFFIEIFWFNSLILKEINVSITMIILTAMGET